MTDEQTTPEERAAAAAGDFDPELEESGKPKSARELAQEQVNKAAEAVAQAEQALARAKAVYSEAARAVVTVQVKPTLVEMNAKVRQQQAGETRKRSRAMEALRGLEGHYRPRTSGTRPPIFREHGQE